MGDIPHANDWLSQRTTTAVLAAAAFMATVATAMNRSSTLPITVMDPPTDPLALTSVMGTLEAKGWRMTVVDDQREGRRAVINLK